MIHILLPYMILPIASVLRQIDRALLRAACGSWRARPWHVFRQVILPLSMPGVAAGVLLVFVLSLGFYITPALVGGPRDIMLSMLIAAAGGPAELALRRRPFRRVLLATALVLIAVAHRLPGLRDASAMTTR